MALTCDVGLIRHDQCVICKTSFNDAFYVMFDWDEDTADFRREACKSRSLFFGSCGLISAYCLGKLRGYVTIVDETG